MSATPRLGIVYLSESQAQKATYVNNGWNVIDSAVARVTGDTFTGAVKITETSASSGTPQADLWTLEAADTNITAGAESNSLLFDMSATRQWATGALTNQRAALFKGPTYAFVGASTLTNAATVCIDAAPVAGTNATITNSWALWVQSGGIQVGSQTTPGLVGISRAAVTSGAPNSLLHVANAADTGLTAGTECSSVKFDFTSTRQWATGSLTSQRAFRILPPTYSFVGASTITTAATVSIEGAPIAGTNATINNSWALYVPSGQCFFNDTITLGPPTNARCMTLTHSTGFFGATIYINPASGTKRTIINFGGIFQFGTDTGFNNTSDCWVQNLVTGNQVVNISAGDVITLGSSNGNGGIQIGFSAGKVSFYGVSPVAQAAAYTLAGSATRTFPTDPSSAYTGIASGVGGTPYAQLTDLNNLRTAVSTLIGVVRQLTVDLGKTSGVGLNAT